MTDDVHERTAKALGIPRHIAQSLNFSFLYRMSLPTSYEDLWPVKQAPLQQFVEQVFEEPGTSDSEE